MQATLAAHRGLCTDFVGIDRVGQQLFSLCAEIDLKPDADADRVAADIAFAVDRFLAPPVLNYTLDEMRARRRADGSLWSIPEIFEGPKLVNGFIDDEELAAADHYEVDDYRRVEVPLRSGGLGWVYVLATEPGRSVDGRGRSPR